MRTHNFAGDQLAILGGQPVRRTFLPYAKQSLEEDDINSVTEVLRSDWLTTGPKVREFEELVSKKTGVDFAVAFSSGTAALHGAAFAAGLHGGDEAITTPMTFVATANCILYMGATPVFADVAPDTLNINVNHVEKLINHQTKAIIPVDFAGHPAELDEILELADKHNLTVIEDAAHAIGATYKNRRIGSISHMTMFSFHPVKHITTGEGGMVTTNNPKIAERLRMFRNHGIDQDASQRQDRREGSWFYQMNALGYNYRISDINCALGISQLNRLPDNLSRRRDIALHYRDAFSELSGVMVPTEHSYVESAWHLYTLKLELDRLTVDRKIIFDSLRAENIGVNVHYIPVHLHPYYRNRFGYTQGLYPTAESAYEGALTLPLFHSMSDADVEDVIKAVYKVVNYYRR